MIRSMTAYGRSERDENGVRVTVEIKSVNHRFRSLSLRIPSDIQYMEHDLRTVINEKISRGHIDVSVSIEREGGESPYEVELDEGLARSYLKVLEKMKALFDISGDIEIETLCRFKDVIMIKPKEVETDEIVPLVLNTLKDALTSFDQMRKTEGQEISEDFRKRLNIVKDLVAEISSRRPEVIKEYSKRLQENVKRLLGGDPVDLDENRLLQEIAIFADKSDITEELVRIDSHIKQFLAFLDYEEPVGRRLDFLLQEMNREVNTIGSKANDVTISRCVVSIKGEIEKIREQVQNIE